MEPEKSRILIDDAVVPAFLAQDSLRYYNLLDMYMMMVSNGKERSEKDWLDLFKMTDERLVLEKVWKEPGSGPQGGTVLELRLRK
jgi:sterigmatocystin 8-O-methyltransferase